MHIKWRASLRSAGHAVAAGDAVALRDAIASNPRALVADLAASDLARQLDPVDRRQLNEALQRTLETAMSGHTNGWRNEFSRNAGTVVASPAFKNLAGQWCRHLVETITIARETRSGNGTACRNVDGTWDLVP